MENRVQYTVTANDMLSGKLQGMNTSAQALEGTMGGLSKIMGTLGIGFAVFKGIEFIKGGMEKVESLHKAMAQVEAGLESTGDAAGISKGQITDMIDVMYGKMKYGREEIADMSAQMLSFGGITEKNFAKIGTAIADVAARTGNDLHSTSIMFGKAFDNPAEGMNKLRRLGVMFSKEQMEQAAKLVAAGKTNEAQQIMLTEIQNKYGKSAEAAFNADPMGKFNKMMGSLQRSMGEAAMEILESLMPALEAIAGVFKNIGKGIQSVIEWFKEHETVTEFLKVTIGSLVTMLVVYNSILKINAMWLAFTTGSTLAYELQLGYLIAMEGGASVAGGVLAGVMAVINVVMAANPVMLIVAGIAILIGVIYEVIKHFHEWGAAMTLILGPIGLIISAFMAIKDHWQSIKDAFTNDGIIGGLKRIGVVLMDTLLYPLQQALELASKIPGLGKLAGEGAAKIKEMRAAMNLITPEESKKTTKGLEKIAKPRAAATGVSKPVGEDKTKSVSGSKVVTINVSIGNLINDFQIKTTNLHESTTAIKDKVVQALTGAIIDSQLLAEG